MSKKNYYAVKNGNRIFTSWDECAKYIKGIHGVKYKGFKTLEECEEFLKPPETIITKALKAMGNPEFNSSYELKLAVWLYYHHISFNTQFDTLQCINPDTGKVLPYDFELVDYKTIVEIQGKQHYCISVDYNKDESELEYSMKKDKYKKQFAIDSGYTFIELPYTSFEDDSFGAIINNKINRV
jgi:hypothetical protein